VLRAKGSQQLLRSDANMNNKYRYLPRHATSNNPDALPIGFVKDTYKGHAYMGFTCAACHTGEVVYNKTAIRVDGAPAMADMDTFLTDLAAAVNDAQINPAVHAKFLSDVKALGHYSDDKAIDADLHKYAIRLTAYRIVNKSSTKYGYARLDAFGRIYNQVLQYIVSADDLETALREMVAENKIPAADLKKSGILDYLAKLKKKPVLTGGDRDKFMQMLAEKLSLKQVLYFRNMVFNAPDAPVSYPFLWDITQHDYLQWNGVVANAGLGPVGRNTGEVIGVFGTMDFRKMHHWTLSALLTGQGFTSHPIAYDSSVNVHNLVGFEGQLKDLHSPKWPETILPKLDPKKVAAGAVVFENYCAGCHAPINRTAGDRRIVAAMTAQDVVGTDNAMAKNSAAYKGFSGIERNAYVGVGPGDLLLARKAPVAALLVKTVTGVVATPDPDRWFGARLVNWASDLITSVSNNNIKASMKSGAYHPDTTQDPLASIRAYKGRALDGIWATAPYLHNGSVPTLYDLLLPPDQRPKTFLVGSREFDPVKVGFKSAGYNGFNFLTTQPGNSNVGHDYGNVPFTRPDGTTLKPITDEQRWALVEYLKSL
jgi:mono/diheme cytochrome c family protein